MTSDTLIQLSKMMSCGGCGKTTTVESNHTCKTCGRMLCGDCGDRCKDHIVFLDRFDTVSDLRGKDRTYENIKAAVLEAGRFSCFDVETDKDGRLFTKLCKDPEIEVVHLGYPWTGVRLKSEVKK